MRSRFLLALLVPLVLASSVARADDDAVTRAKKRFTLGAQAYRESRYRDAIDFFLQAYQFDPKPEFVYNVGQAYEKIGEVPNALRSYREYLRLAPGAADRATIEASIKNLEARLRERGVQQISIFSSPAGAAVLLDNRSVGQTPWTGEIAPGRHMIVLKATGFPDTAKEFVLTGERAMDIDIALGITGSAAVQLPADPGAKKPAEPAGKPATIAPDQPKPAGGVKPWTIAALGVGALGIGAAVGLEVARKGAEDAARADKTQVGFKDKYDSMVGLQTGSRVLVGVGAAAMVVGGVLLALDIRSMGKAPPAKAAFGCFVNGCSAIAWGSF